MNCYLGIKIALIVLNFSTCINAQKWTFVWTLTRPTFDNNDVGDDWFNIPDFTQIQLNMASFAAVVFPQLTSCLVDINFFGRVHLTTRFSSSTQLKIENFLPPSVLKRGVSKKSDSRTSLRAKKFANVREGRYKRLTLLQAGRTARELHAPVLLGLRHNSRFPAFFCRPFGGAIFRPKRTISGKKRIRLGDLIVSNRIRRLSK